MKKLSNLTFLLVSFTCLGSDPVSVFSIPSLPASSAPATTPVTVAPPVSIPAPSISTSTPVPSVNAAPPSFPSSSYAFGQIAQPTSTANQSVDPSQLPCFQAYDILRLQANASTNQCPPSQALIGQVQTKAITPSEANNAFKLNEAAAIKKANYSSGS